MRAPVEFRQAILQAFRRIGGVKHLSNWAQDNPTEFYRLAGRLLVHEKPAPAPTTFEQVTRFTTAHQLPLFPNPASPLSTDD